MMTHSLRFALMMILILIEAPITFPAVVMEEDLRRTDLKIAVEKQRGIMEQEESRANQLRFEVETAEEVYQLAEKKIKEMESGNEKTRGLFYQDVQGKPLSRSGHFYEQALYQKKEAEESLKKIRKDYRGSLRKLKNERRLFLEQVQRLKDYDEEK
ncbi:MAG: hypothetical protein EXS63_08775 [Candidatus Omnitrophica bacterium]|nr:hypothetical protein [Candidatus Omnitrophota bacterium]